MADIDKMTAISRRTRGLILTCIFPLLANNGDNKCSLFHIGCTIYNKKGFQALNFQFMLLYLSSLHQFKSLSDITRVKQLKEKLSKEESRLVRLMGEAERIWEETGLDPKVSSYLVEKTMRFEMAQKNIATIFSAIKELIESYKRLCQELENVEQ